jgi:hypothetical protein
MYSPQWEAHQGWSAGTGLTTTPRFSATTSARPPARATLHVSLSTVHQQTLPAVAWDFQAFLLTGRWLNHTVVAGGLQCDSQVRKTVSLFWSFPYVCPEPVLAKCSFLYINGSKMPFFAELRPMPSEQRWLHRAGCYGDERARPLTVTDLPVARPRG